MSEANYLTFERFFIIKFSHRFLLCRHMLLLHLFVRCFLVRIVKSYFIILDRLTRVDHKGTKFYFQRISNLRDRGTISYIILEWNRQNHFIPFLSAFLEFRRWFLLILQHFRVYHHDFAGHMMKFTADAASFAQKNESCSWNSEILSHSECPLTVTNTKQNSRRCVFLLY